jgi:hypothetical protein
MKVALNKPQARFVLSKPKEAISIWGRGTGKSFLIAFLIDMLVKHMPRATALMVGSTFKQMLEITLPSTRHALELLGYIKDTHYFVGRTPPKSWQWPTPLMPSARGYDNCLYFYSGTVIRLVSQDRNSTSVRGFNADFVFSDEALMLDKKRFDDEVSPTNRGNLEQFKHVPFHHGVFHFTSMPVGSEGEWLTEAGNYYLEDGYDYRKLMDNIIDAQLEIIDEEKPQERLKLWKEMAALYEKLTFYKNKKGMLYSEANIFENIQHIGFKYVLNERDRISNDSQFKREMLNKLVSKVEGGFYPTFDRDKHCYRGQYNYDSIGDLDKFNFKSTKKSDCSMDEDLISGLPLTAGIDWGGKINFLVISQKLHSQNRINILNNLFVKSPGIIDDLAEDFCVYYEKHNKKVLNLWYDNSGNNRQPNSKLTYAQQFKQILSKRGWTVHLKTKGNTNPEHQRKFLLISRLFDERLRSHPTIRINLNNCRELVIAMELAPVKDERGRISKDKASERKDSQPQEFATHGTDAFDSLIYGEYKHLLQHSHASIPLGVRVSK